MTADEKEIIVRAGEGGAFAEDYVAWCKQDDDYPEHIPCPVGRAAALAILAKVDSLVGRRVKRRFAAFEAALFAEERRATGDDAGDWVDGFRAAFSRWLEAQP